MGLTESLTRPYRQVSVSIRVLVEEKRIGRVSASAEVLHRTVEQTHIEIVYVIGCVEVAGQPSLFRRAG